MSIRANPTDRRLSIQLCLSPVRSFRKSRLNGRIGYHANEEGSPLLQCGLPLFLANVCQLVHNVLKCLEKRYDVQEFSFLSRHLEAAHSLCTPTVRLDNPWWYSTRYLQGSKWAFNDGVELKCPYCYEILLTNIGSGCVRRGERKTNRETFIHPCRHHVQLPAVVDGTQQLLVQFIGALGSETHQTQL